MSLIPLSSRKLNRRYDAAIPFSPGYPAIANFLDRRRDGHGSYSSVSPSKSTTLAG